MSDKAERVQRMFAAIARSYDLNNRLHSFGRDQAWRRRVVKLCHAQSTEAVLDVACGTGELAEAFADAGPQSVVGADFTEEMLQVARAKSARRSACAGRLAVDYRWGDAMSLPFDDASFDVVSIAFGIRNVSDPSAALREFKRVLRPGGRLAVLEFSRPRNFIVRALNGLYTTHIMPLTASLIAGDRSGAYRYLPRSIQTFHTSDEMIGNIRDVGFSDVTPHSMTFGVCTAYLGRVS